MNETVIKRIYENSNNAKFIGIGETGLDFFYNHSDKKSQIQSFEKHIEISQDLSLPLIIHMREAEEDTVRIIKHKIKSKNFNGVIHCFTGTQKFADEMIELGFYISASGIITFKKSDELRSVFKSISNNRLLIETDSPYLSPEPLRGKINQPSHIIHTIKKLAEIRNTDYDHIVSITNENFFKLFTKINKK